MQSFDKASGRAYPLGRDNIDTDIILPGRFLKTVTRTGLGTVAFETIRAEPGNIFDDPKYQRAPLLISGKNFGCGSSREHAVWAMMDMGIQVVLAESYSDIFSDNAFKNGLLAIALDQDAIAILLQQAQGGDVFEIDLRHEIVRSGEATLHFEIDPFRKDCLLRGLDEIGLTLALDSEIKAFEHQRADRSSWLEVLE